MADDRVMTASASPSTPHTQSAAKVLSQAAATVGSGSVPHALVEIPAAWADGTATVQSPTVRLRRDQQADQAAAVVPRNRDGPERQGDHTEDARCRSQSRHRPVGTGQGREVWQSNARGLSL